MFKRIKEVVGFLLTYIQKEKCMYSFVFSAILIFITALMYIPIPNLLGNITNLLNISKPEQNIQNIITTIIILFLLYIARYFLSVYSKNNFAKIEKKVVSSVKIDMLQKYLDMPMEEIEKEPKGVSMGRIEETAQLSQVFSPGFIGMILNFFEFLFSIIIIGAMNIYIICILCMIIPLYYCGMKKISDKIGTATVELYQTSNVLTNKIFETINGTSEIKILNGQDFILKGIKKETEKNIMASVKQNKLLFVFTENVQLVYNVMNLTMISFLVLFILMKQINFAEYIILSGYIVKILSFVQGFSSVDTILQPVYVAMKRIKTFLEIRGESENKKIPIEHFQKIEFEGVYFKYGDSQRCVLEDVNLSYELNNKLRIKGQNGTGKSTIVKLMIGVYRPLKGRILINDIPIEKIDVFSLRKRVGIVSQDIVLFNDTIENNILLDRDDISEDVLDILIEKLQLKGFFESFENGSKTIISKNSIGISGGQAKIIALLRALVAEKDIIILDEFSANVDSVLTQKIIDAFRNDEICMSLIVISHTGEWNWIQNVYELPVRE